MENLRLTGVRTFKEWLEVLPEVVRNRFRLECKRNAEWFRERGGFDDLINRGLSWDSSESGREYWEKVHLCADIEQVLICEKYIARPYEEIMNELNPERREILSYFVGDSIIKSGIIKSRGRIENLVNIIIWDDTTIKRTYWEAIARGEETDYTRETERYYTQTTEVDGEQVPRYMLVKLERVIYGAETFARKDKTISVEVRGRLGNSIILKSDSVRAYVGRSTERHFYNGDLAKWDFIEFEGKYYLDRSVLEKFGVYKIEGVGYEHIDPRKHITVGGKYYRAENKPENLVYVNEKGAFNVSIYDYKDSYYIFACAIDGLYYSESYVNKYKAYFSESEGVKTEIVISSRNTQSGQVYRGQVVDLFRCETGNRDSIVFLSKQSAKNYGLSITTCPHCEKEVSQFHDLQACKRANFKNVRYDYHSQKPKKINSSAVFKIGVEIEKESMDGATHKAPSIYNRFGWVKERDGSLDSQVGYELVSPCYPLFSNKLMQEAEKIEQDFPQLINGEVSASCGGHIHFSKYNTTGRETLQQHCGYLPLLYAIYKSRTTKNYSQAKEKEEIKDSGEKYQAVRVLPDRIEFRIFPAVKNLASLKWRIELLRYMAKNPTENPLKVVNDLCDKRTALHKLFLEIFAEQTIYKRALDTLLMAQKYDRNFYNIDFSKQAKGIRAKAKKSAKKK